MNHKNFNQVVVESMQWSSLSPIADVKPIGDDDANCLNEIRDFLAKPGQLERFGVSLFHSHFLLPRKAC